MIDDWFLSLIYAAWLAASTMPLGFMLGASCSPCCLNGCGDSKALTDPKDEGTWVPSGTWNVTGVTWTFTSNPGNESGETWFFYGSVSTSKAGGSATDAEATDWGNICNWYSNKTTNPSSRSNLPAVFNRRATRLPPSDAVVHVYTSVSTVNSGAQTVKHIYFWDSGHFGNSSITTTSLAHDSNGGAVFFNTAQNRDSAVINGGGLFVGGSNTTSAVVNGGATFTNGGGNMNSAVVNDSATFIGLSRNSGFAVVNGGATFSGSSENRNGVVNDGATFNQSSRNIFLGVVNGGATFNDDSSNRDSSTVNGGATFNDISRNTSGSVVNGGATFNDSSRNNNTAIVNGGATFNDASVNAGTVNP